MGVLAPVLYSQSPYCDVKLIDSYRCELDKSLGVLASSGRIYKEEGLVIYFEEGMNQGHWANENEISKYAWYLTRNVHGRTLKIAMIKDGVRSIWEPKQPRDSVIGRILLVTIPMDDDRNNAVNFRAEILTEPELLDAISMILTFKGSEFGGSCSEKGK